MLVALTITTCFLAVALVAVVAIVLAAANRDSARRVEQQATMLRAIIARSSTDELGPGAELRAYRALERDAQRHARMGPLVGSEVDSMDEMEKARDLRTSRAVADGLIDERGAHITPTGF